MLEEYKYNQQKIKKYAGFWIRLAASFIDNIIIAIPLFLIYHYTFDDAHILKPTGFLEYYESRFIIAWYLILLTSSLFFTYKHQSTLGKSMLKLEVISSKSDKLTLRQTILREIFGKTVSMLILLLTLAAGFFVGGFDHIKTALLLTLIAGFFISGYNKKKQALHDKIASTLVIHKNPNKKNKLTLVAKVLLILILVVTTFYWVDVQNKKNNERLIKMIRIGDKFWTERAIKDGADVDTRDEKGCTALHFAVSSYAAGKELYDFSFKFLSKVEKDNIEITEIYKKIEKIEIELKNYDYPIYDDPFLELEQTGKIMTTGYAKKAEKMKLENELFFLQDKYRYEKDLSDLKTIIKKWNGEEKEYIKNCSVLWLPEISYNDPVFSPEKDSLFSSKDRINTIYNIIAIRDINNSNLKEIILLLLENGADVDAETIFSETPLDIAIKGNSPEIVEELLMVKLSKEKEKFDKLKREKPRKKTSVEILYKLEKGDILKFNMKMDSYTGIENAVSIFESRSATFEYEVMEITNNNEIILEGHLKKIAVDMISGEDLVSFDSSAPGFMERAREDSGFQDLIYILEHPFSITIDNLGKVIDYEIYQSEEMLSETNSQIIAHLESFLEQAAEGTFFGLPEKNIRIGESWSGGKIALFASEIGTVKGSPVYFFSEIINDRNGKQAIIKSYSDLILEADEESQISLKVIKGLSSGTNIFSINKGYLSYAEGMVGVITETRFEGRTVRAVVYQKIMIEGEKIKKR